MIIVFIGDLKSSPDARSQKVLLLKSSFQKERESLQLLRAAYRACLNVKQNHLLHDRDNLP